MVTVEGERGKKSYKDRGHETKGSVALGYNVRLYVSVVILAGPHEGAVGLQGLAVEKIIFSVTDPK